MERESHKGQGFRLPKGIHSEGHVSGPFVALTPAYLERVGVPRNENTAEGRVSEAERECSVLFLHVRRTVKVAPVKTDVTHERHKRVRVPFSRPDEIFFDGVFPFLFLLAKAVPGAAHIAVWQAKVGLEYIKKNPFGREVLVEVREYNDAEMRARDDRERGRHPVDVPRVPDQPVSAVFLDEKPETVCVKGFTGCLHA